jgi:putative Mg2+ transporter-C (MgtC) family protein
MENVWLQTVIRLGVAVIAGGVVGLDRQLSGRPAGLRTHMLVSLGSALIVSIPLVSGARDANAVIQGVATGVGFLCAGEILHRIRDGHEHVRGLTSAASLWVTAALGMVSATGHWPLVVIGTAMTVVILAVLRRLEPRITAYDAGHTSAKPSAPAGPEGGA